MGPPSTGDAGMAATVVTRIDPRGLVTDEPTSGNSKGQEAKPAWITPLNNLPDNADP